MEARELRLGNCVMYDRPCRIHALTANPPIITIEFGLCVVYPPFKNTQNYSEHYSFTSIEDIDPIPLTPEILEKAGFRRIELISALEVELNLPPSAKPIVGYEKKVRELTLNWVEGDGIYLSGFSFDLPHVKSLHQLQNLYWCLVGEELEINL